MTIGTFLWLIDPTTPRGLGLDNGSMTVVSFEKENLLLSLSEMLVTVFVVDNY